nr:putative ribonuclease h protein [Quercus suber]
MDEETRQWNRATITHWFEPHICVDILSVPLPNVQENDALVWKENKSNDFFIKSSYSVALRMLQHSSGDHSNAATDKRTWKAVWSLNTPLKVQTFLWCACSNILPTCDNLHAKRVQLDSTCLICKQQCETVGHILWECPFACSVWALAKGKIHKSSTSAPDFFLLTRTMVQRLNQTELEQWVVIAWGIWNARNKFCFKNTHAHPGTTLRGTMSFLHEYQNLVANQHTC